MSVKNMKSLRSVAAALLVLAAGEASAVPPLPSFDGVNPLVSGILPFVGSSGGRGVVRTSGASTGSTVFATVNGNTANIQTNAQRMVIDWQSFSIGEGYRVNFLLPDRASIAVNRVRGVGSEFISRIDGDLWSNGNVWLLNPNGVFFGANARVDVAGLLATPAYLRNLDELIRSDGNVAPFSEVRFNMPGSSFPTEVTKPGAIDIAPGAEILVRGGPAMFIVGSGVQGRTLTVGGTVTSRSSDLTRGLLSPPSASSPSGGYGSLLTDSDPAEEISSQVVYAASGDFALTLAERSIAEPALPNPLSSNDLDLFDLVIERGFAGLQDPQDRMATEVIFIDSPAKTVAGQVVARAAAESSVVNRRYDPRTDLGSDLGCDTSQPNCTITANPDHDTYVYHPGAGDYELLCAKGPATETCGTLQGEQTATGFLFSAYLGVESASRTDYGCGAEDPDCSPGILIRSSLTALDPRGQALEYGIGMDRSLIVDAAPGGYRGNLPLNRGVDGRLTEVIAYAASNPGSVFVDSGYAQSRPFDFGVDGGPQQLALEFVSAGDIKILGRDVCVTNTVCFEPDRIYDPRYDPFYADRVNLRLKAGPGHSSSITARRLMRLEETHLSGASLSFDADYNGPSQGDGQAAPALRQLVIRNGFVDPRAGTIDVGFGGGRTRVTVGTAGVNPENDITLGSIYGDESTEVIVVAARSLRIVDFDGSTATPGEVNGRYLDLTGGLAEQTVMSMGDIHLLGDITLEGFGLESTPALSLYSFGELAFGRIYTATGRDDIFIGSGRSLDFDPVAKLGPDAAVRLLRLYSYDGSVCIGATVAGQCVVTELALTAAPNELGTSVPTLEIFGRTGVTAGDVRVGGYVTRLTAERGNILAGDIDSSALSVAAGKESAFSGTPWVDAPGAFSVTVGDINVLNRGGNLLLQGRDGVTAGDILADGAIIPPGESIGLYSKTGSIVAGAVRSTATGDYALNAETQTGALISMTSAEAGRVRLHAPEGAVKIGTGSGSAFTGGAVTARNGGMDISGREGVAAGALTAAAQVDVSAARGKVAVGDIRAGGTAPSSGSPCDGLAVCIGAGFDGTDGSGRTLTTGSVTATTGAVLMVGRDGVTTGGGVLASAGGVEIRSPSGTVDTSAGAVTAGTTTGAFDAKLVGNSLNLGDVAARRDIDLSATAPTGALTTGVLTAGRALTVRSVTDLGIGATKIGGTPQSVLLASSDGSVCLGARVNGVCTGQALTKATDLTLQGKTGVTTGALAVRSALVDSAQGALALGDVTATDGKLALYGRTGVTAGKLTQSRTGVPPTAPDIDLLSAAGAITVGDVAGTGLMYGRAAEGLTTGAIAGLKDIDLRSGKALATGAVTATGFVQLESLEGSLTTGAVSAGAAKSGPGTDPCSGKAVCLQAGETASAGTQSVGTGTLRATTGDILVRGRSGVTVGDATATTGSVTLRSSAGAITGAAIDAGKLVDVQAQAGRLALGAVTARDGTVLLRGRDGVTAGRISQARTGGALQVPDVALSADQGAVSVGDIGSTGSVRGFASGDLAAGSVTAVTGASLVAGGALAAGDIDSQSFVQLESGTGTLTAGDITARDVRPGTATGDPCSGKSICVRAGEGANSGTQTLRAGDLVATTGNLLVAGRSGVTLDSARADRGSITVEAVAGGVTSGALTAGDVQASAPLPYQVGIQARDAITIGTAASPAPVQATGEILMFSTAGNIDAGALTAGRYIDVDAAGSLRLGALSARGTQLISATDPCNGASVCVTAGGGPQTGLQTATVGPITADAGAVFLAAPTVMLGGATASDGDLMIRSGSGAVTATGDLVAGGSGSTAADRDVIIISGGSIAVRGVRASGDITLEANGASGSSGTINTGALQARRALSLQSAAGLNVVATDIVGDPESIRLASGGGSVCLGTLVNDVCTGQALSKNSTGVELVGRTGVTTGDLGAKSVRVTVSEGSAMAGALTSAQGVSIAARDGVKTGDVAAQKEVSLVASAGMVDAGRVAAADGTVLLQGRTGVKAGAITQARSGAPLQVPDVDLIADGGSITVGAVSGSGSLRGRALDDLAIGAVSGVDAVDLSAGKALSASGAIAARGAVELRSDTGSLAVQDVTAGAAKVGGSTDPCAGKAVCVRAGAGASSGTQTLTAGKLTASAGDVLVRGRSGVTTGDLRTDRGVIDIGAAAGGATLGDLASAGALTVTARDAVTAGAVAAATGSAGDVSMTSTDGALTVKSVTAGTTTVASSVLLKSKGNLGVTSGGSTRGDVTASGSARLESATAVRVGAVTVRDGTLQLIGPGSVSAGVLSQSRSGAPGSTPDLEVLADQGAVAIGATTATGGVRVTSQENLSASQVSARGPVDLVATTGTLSVAGPVSSTDAAVNLAGRAGVVTGAVSARSIVASSSDGGVALGDLASAGALTVTARDAVTAGAVTAATGTAGDVSMTSTTGAIAVKSVDAGSSTVASDVMLTAQGRVGVGVGQQSGTLGGVAASGGVRLESKAADVRVGDVTARNGRLQLLGQQGASTGFPAVFAGALTQSRSGAAGTTPDVEVVGGQASVSLRSVDATGPVSVSSTSGVVIGQTVRSGGAVRLAGSTVDTKDITAGGDIDLRVGSAIGSAAIGAVRSDGAVRIDAGSRLDAASVAAAGSVSAQAGRIVVGSGSGSSFVGGAVTSGTGAVTLAGTNGVATGELRGTDVTATASGGDVDIGAVTARTLAVSAAAGTAGAGDVRLGGAVTLTPATGTPAGATPALRVQAARDITVAGTVTSERNVAFVAGRTFTNTGAIGVTAGTAADGSGAAGYGGIDIRAADAEIGAQLRSRGAGVNILATGTGGIAVGDGVTAAAGAMRLTNAELQSIDAPTAALRSAATSSAGRDIVVGDLTLDRTRVGDLTLATRQGGKVKITGTVRGTGAPALQIGESGMRPDAIEVSGALGASDAALGALQLRSAGNILFGPQAFIDAANAAQDIRSFDVDAASQGATAGRLFLVSGATSFDTPGAILQQNTGTSARDGNGIRIGAPAGVVTSTFANGTPPQRIALFGSVVDAQGVVAGAQAAALVTGLLPSGVAADPAWRINTCIIGTGAGCATAAVLPPPSVLVQPPLPPPPPPVPSSPASPLGAENPPPTAASGSAQGGQAGPGGPDGPGGSTGPGGGDEEDESGQGGEPEAQPVPTLADAAPTAEEQRIYPLEVDPGSRDLLRPVDDGTPREPGVGSANEDLWPQGAPPP